MRNPVYAAQLHFIDSNGRELDPTSNAYAQPLSIVESYVDKQWDTHLEFTERYGLEIPENVQALASNVTRFLGSCGLASTANIYMISTEGRQVREVEYQAECKDMVDAIYLYADKCSEIVARYGEVALGAVLAHELAHASRPEEVLGLSLYPDKNSKWIRRTGFNILLPDGSVAGKFYEEAFAEFCAGLWVRRSVDPQSALVSVGRSEVPSRLMPDHYPKNTSVAGPDGYCIELLAYGVEKRGIAPAGVFIEAFFASRNSETRTAALRTIAQCIDRIQPGLYRELRRLTYSRENWSHALQQVHDAVTH